jgi:hypothetical protein
MLRQPTAVISKLLACLACSMLMPGNTSATGHASPCGDAPLRELASIYRTYRALRQHDPDLHTPALSHWNGDMHHVMTQLGDGLAAQHASATCAQALLGPPDETRSSGQRHGTVLVGSAEKHLVYWWRGGHDYLYLVVREGNVTEARWWFAGE